ncbi:DUF2537 domain-containing protein [Actinopolyspora mortivallis]|uniref:DUF2537 domain-containing protein n=1 Tax=Actinopolyspora mortivallis TaxID=33906 RepID=UPI0003689D25|nr:DUF2537 domain-containing protein [Actinopolyspora mortivallis]
MNSAAREEPELELRAGRGGAVLVDTVEWLGLSPEHLGVSAELAAALGEWAEVIERMRRGELAAEEVGPVVARRGERLAARLATETGEPIGYRDPVGGQLRRVAPPGHGRGAGRGHEEVSPSRAAVPWRTGLTVSALTSALVAVSLVVVSLGIGEVSPVLAVVINLAVACGFAPSIWLGRRVPVWRWTVLGLACGIGISWVVLPLSLLG